MPSALLPCIISFLVGLWLGSYLRYIPLSVLALLVIFAVVTTWCERQGFVSPIRGLLFYACILLGVGYWNIAEFAQHSSLLLHETGSKEVLLSGVVSEPVQHSPGRLTLVVDVESIGEAPTQRMVKGKLRLTWREPNKVVYRGEHISVRTRLRAPFGTRNPGGFDYGAYLQQRGVEAVGMVKGADHIQVRSPQVSEVGPFIWNQIDQWRNEVRHRVLSSLNDPAKGLFLGMIIGEQQYIAQDVRDDFMTTGTVHIISISGSHLGLLAFLSFLSVRGMTRRIPASWLERLSCWITPQQIAVLITIPLVVFYTLLSGSHVATVRSLLMIFLYLFAVWVGHERQILTALAVSALLATVFDPKVIYDLSFQLSYMSVLAIALVLKWPDSPLSHAEALQPFQEKVKTWASQYFLISCSATLATLPLEMRKY